MSHRLGQPLKESLLAGQQAAPRPTLQLFDAVALIVGIVVGSGLFRTPSLVASHVSSAAFLLLAWVLGGGISLVGALCYAELASAYPHAGGDYHYLRRAFGARLSFLFAWARMTVTQTGSIALLAFVFGDYATRLLRLGEYSPSLYAALIIAALTGLNLRGVRQGARTQNVLTTVKVLGIVLLIISGLALAVPLPPVAHDSPSSAPATQPSLGLVMIFVLLTYGGWNEAAYISAELHNARRNMARALLCSLLLITGLYLMVNWACLQGLGLKGMAQSQTVAADLMQRALGEHGAQFVSLLVAVSTLSSVNATIFTGARTSYALGRDFPPFSFLGRWRQGSSTPTNALLVQATVALALVLLGTITRKGFETMVEYTAPVYWFFFLLTGVSLPVLRVREPGASRPFRVPLYPLTPFLFCATSAYLLYSSLAYTGVGALVGLAVLGVGALLLPLARSSDYQLTINQNVKQNIDESIGEE
jgi:APA family basic amino acid/polyamine antiporter